MHTRRRQTIRSEPFAWALMDAAPDGVVVIEDGGRVVFANRRAEELFGYSRGELLNISVEALVPESLQGAHLNHRTEYGADPHARSMGDGRRVQGRHRDGSSVPMEVNLSPVYKDRSRIVIATIRPARQELGMDRPPGPAASMCLATMGDLVHHANEIALQLKLAPMMPGPDPILAMLDELIRLINLTVLEGALAAEEMRDEPKASVD